MKRDTHRDKVLVFLATTGTGEELRTPVKGALVFLDPATAVGASISLGFFLVLRFTSVKPSAAVAPMCEVPELTASA
jgi:hypothetical protein